LQNGLTCSISSLDDNADLFLEVFCQSLYLDLYNSAANRSHIESNLYVIYVSSNRNHKSLSDSTCHTYQSLFINPQNKARWPLQDLWHLSSLISQKILTLHGTPLHGALIVKGTEGLLLIGGSGIGKSTACRRLPDDWITLSDDRLLVVKDHNDDYWAHPWPSWMHKITDDEVQRWNVEHAVKVKGLYFLEQADSDGIALMGSGEAAALLFDSAEQGAYLPGYTFTRDQNLQRFDVVCKMANSLPCYRLYVSLNGEFWKLLE
jgi:SynChlorMet cassette protein ScmC